MLENIDFTNNGSSIQMLNSSINDSKKLNVRQVKLQLDMQNNMRKINESPLS